ncbi:uncharacterized protein LOC124815426 [Hydra vulgaris]|uniref:uncharacterized protein LOC124815426 n=1 Tax=Hydra vulgaris TaxID=6087 RepID=UPI001F5F8256|nr:uncharacterized protein LOC124815426 [Hydra vulgaris]
MLQLIGFFVIGFVRSGGTDHHFGAPRIYSGTVLNHFKPIIRVAIYRLRNDVGKPLLMLACRHHVLEAILKHYWLAVTIDKTTGPDNTLFKGLKSKWNDIDVKNCVITHFKWQSIYDSWFNEQAEKARKCLMTIVNEGVFKNSQRHEKRADYQELLS